MNNQLQYLSNSSNNQYQSSFLHNHKTVRPVIRMHQFQNQCNPITAYQPMRRDQWGNATWLYLNVHLIPHLAVPHDPPREPLHVPPTGEVLCVPPPAIPPVPPLLRHPVVPPVVPPAVLHTKTRIISTMYVVWCCMSLWEEKKEN